MTTSAAARRRSTWIGLVLVVVALVAAGVLAVIGGATLANSQAGRDVSQDDVGVLRFPSTPTALLGAVDASGRLTGVVSLVVDPTGVGGSIVSIPPTGDSTLDLGDERLPLDETLANDGPEAFRAQAEALTGISYDVVELADAPRLTEILGELGTLTVELPFAVEVPGDGAEPLALDAGEQEVSPELAAQLLTLTQPGDEPDHLLDPMRDAVWSAVADRIGAGIGSATTVSEGVSVPTPANLDELLARLFAGEVGWRGVAVTVPSAERNPTGADVVVPDRADLLLVFGQIAPGRVGAPNPSLTFRLEVDFSAEELAPLGLTNADVARDAINRLLFVQANVVSVATADDGAPDVSQVAVADEAVTDVVVDSYPLVFGELELVDLDYRIEGVDVIVVLGRSYLDLLQDQPLTEADLEGTAFEPDDSSPDDSSPDDTAATTDGTEEDG